MYPYVITVSQFRLVNKSLKEIIYLFNINHRILTKLLNELVIDAIS